MAQNNASATVSAAFADEQMQVRVAWLYYMEGRTQAEIADELSTNRLRINRIISEARRSGLVSIKLNSNLTSCVELERHLMREFGLKRAVIIPTPREESLVPVLLGQATAEYLTHRLSSDAISGIGVGWGATLREMVRHMPTLRFPQASVNSVMGGLTRGIEINTFDIASDLARQLGAECAYLAAPIYTGSPSSQKAIVGQDVFHEAFEQVRASEIILLSIGDLTEKSLLMRYGLPKDVSPDELAAAGACGDVMGQFIDAGGQPVDHAINRRAIALPLDDLRRIPEVVFTSGGMNKAQAIAAVLLSGLGNVLICDEDTARTARELALAQRTQQG
jgi:DNA-binding transcriptional regulator LsrR (DeoR family)